MKKLAFIGAGSMAEAVISGVIEKKFIDKVNVFVTNKENQSRLEEIKNIYGTTCVNNKEEAIQHADIVIIATKPADVKTALENIRTHVFENQLIVSVVAGISTTYINKILQKDNPVIRSMPNTSATIGLSATAIAKGEFATDEHIEIAKEMFEAIGTVSVVAEENMHIVTGISGSGPAYVYYLVEAMQQAAKEEGLDEAIAKQLISQTLIGAGTMLQQRSESPQTLRENVTSPNGTTAAGLAALQEYNFLEAVKSCVKSATSRSKELGQANE